MTEQRSHGRNTIMSWRHKKWTAGSSEVRQINGEIISALKNSGGPNLPSCGHRWFNCFCAIPTTMALREWVMMILRRRSCNHYLERRFHSFWFLIFQNLSQRSSRQSLTPECHPPPPSPSYTWAPALKSSCLCLTRWSTSPHIQVSQVHTNPHNSLPNKVLHKSTPTNCHPGRSSSRGNRAATSQEYS